MTTDQSHTNPLVHIGRFAAAFVVRAALLAALWTILTGGEWESWAIGAPVVLAATIVSVWITPAGYWRISLVHALAFVPFFLWESLVGSFDVSYRALHPSRPIKPGLIHHRLSLEAEGPARMFFCGLIGLMPGTVSKELTGDRLTIHALTLDDRLPDRLHRIERRVSRIFRAPLHPHQ